MAHFRSGLIFVLVALAVSPVSARELVGKEGLVRSGILKDHSLYYVGKSCDGIHPASMRFVESFPENRLLIRKRLHCRGENYLLVTEVRSHKMALVREDRVEYSDAVLATEKADAKLKASADTFSVESNCARATWTGVRLIPAENESVKILWSQRCADRRFYLVKSLASGTIYMVERESLVAFNK